MVQALPSPAGLGQSEEMGQSKPWALGYMCVDVMGDAWLWPQAATQDLTGTMLLPPAR